MMTMTKEQALKDLKQRYGTPGDPIYMAGISTIKDEYSNLLTVKEIRDFLAQSRTYTVHYAYKPVKFNPYYIWSLRQRIQVDLTETSKISKYNNGYNYILVAIDCFSRKIWVKLLKTKTAEEVLSSFKAIMKETGHFSSVESDQGKEFLNKDFKNFCKQHRISMKIPYNHGHAPHVERVQSTLQNLIYKYITSTMNFRFIHKLQSFVDTYNNRKHRMTQLTPNQGELPKNHDHIRLMHQKYYNSVKPTKIIRFNVGDFVRIARLKPKFGRGYDKTSPEEIYKVTRIITEFPRVLFKISTLDGEDVIGSFYQEQLTKVTNQDEYIIEKVIRKKKGEVLVKFLGYEKPEWIREANLTTIKDIQ